MLSAAVVRGIPRQRCCQQGKGEGVMCDTSIQGNRPEFIDQGVNCDSKRLARFEPARSHLPAGALFDPAPASAKWCGSFTASSDMEKEGLAHRRFVVGEDCLYADKIFEKFGQD